jgi:FixJ family two-component response regulator
MHISVIDDDSSVCNALRRLLASANVSADIFGSGREFLAAQPTLLDCIVLDLKMPGINGLEMLRILKACRVEIPVVIITASDTATARLDCKRLGAFAFLAKPFEEQDFFSAIKAAIAGSAEQSATALAPNGAADRRD